MKPVAGVFVLLLGAVLLLWIGYNLFIEMQPEAEGHNPIVPALIGVGMVYVGITWIRGKQAD